MRGAQLWIGPIDAGSLTKQELNERKINPFAVDLLVESVTGSQLLDAVPEGVSFVLNSPDRRHQGVRISITKEP